MVAPRGNRPVTRAAGGAVRIIGGSLRGSKLPVVDLPGLRPSSDRVRETLFNWLQRDLPGARVLDLFAGSGALGFEAASRGAASVVLVERDPRAAAALAESAARLQVRTLSVRCADALAADSLLPGECFDGAFIDPPFASGLCEAALHRVLPHLAEDAWLYLESAIGESAKLGPGWRCDREGSTREVRYALYRRTG